MLTLLNISNFALIDELSIEFDRGLNLLTGETGSGKSIIVDALSVLIGGRFPSDLIKTGASSSSIEGLFAIDKHPQVESILQNAGLEPSSPGNADLVIRREQSAAGRGRIFVNNRLATLAVLRELRPFLVDIHGQGDQQTLFDTSTHLELLDAFAGASALRSELTSLYARWASLNQELNDLRRDEAEKLQLTDTLRFQIQELRAANLIMGEDDVLDEERKRLNNLERLTTICAETYEQSYESGDSTASRLAQLERWMDELSQYDSSFSEYREGLGSARVMVEEFALSVRAFADSLNFSPGRLGDIESRLAEITRLKRKYGGTIEMALDHLAESTERLASLERSDEQAVGLERTLSRVIEEYMERARKLTSMRSRAAIKLKQAVEKALGEVAMEAAQFEAQVSPLHANGTSGNPRLTPKGIDAVEFTFSANAGEFPKSLSKVASGGEASRLMLVLKTITNPTQFPRTIVFDEIDTGIGGRVSEAVGFKLKSLANSNQVLCVTHQAQIARLADVHFVINKRGIEGRTHVEVVRLDSRARVEEIARMLTGAQITDAARRHAREMLKSA